MYNVINKQEIQQKIEALKQRGLKENVDFRVVYFSNKAELQMVK